ncbi:MAG: hypothetical protein LBV23_06010 [Deltaproteobacteria bacterium]|jgi:hypothetical protein|nr:hypothetical protein [Deltaproteobacteria bacterium]
MDEIVKELIKISGHFKVVNKIVPNDQIADLTMDVLLAFFEYTADAVKGRHRFRLEPVDYDILIVYMPLPGLKIDLKLIFKIRPRKEQFDLTDITCGKWQRHKEDSRNFVRFLYTDLRARWFIIERLRAEINSKLPPAPPSPPAKPKGCGCFTMIGCFFVVLLVLIFILSMVYPESSIIRMLFP